jgi:hypothetical protein
VIDVLVMRVVDLVFRWAVYLDEREKDQKRKIAESDRALREELEGAERRRR